MKYSTTAKTACLGETLPCGYTNCQKARNSEIQNANKALLPPLLSILFSLQLAQNSTLKSQLMYQITEYILYCSISLLFLDNSKGPWWWGLGWGYYGALITYNYKKALIKTSKKKLYWLLLCRAYATRKQRIRTLMQQRQFVWQFIKLKKQGLQEFEARKGRTRKAVHKADGIVYE